MARVERRSVRKRAERRGGVHVFVAVSLTAIIGFAALAVDVSALYSAQAELQREADAAALAAAAELVAGIDGQTQTAALDQADLYAQLNSVMRVSVGLDSESDVEFGRALYDGATGKFTFSPGGEVPDAIRVTVRRTEGSAGGPISLAFGRMFGRETQGLEARAAAVLVPRDIACVIDLSGSMTWDSGLLYWNRTDGGYANLRDCWAALNGPEPSRPYTPAVETASEYASDTGPAIGAMNLWGNPLIPGSYSASSDSGLWYVKKGSNTSNASISASLTSRGYSADEISIIMSASKDGTVANQFRYRCAVMLGLATWNSGRAGGHPGGDGDSTMESAEISWAGYPSFRGSWSWLNYVDFMQNGQSNDASSFRYRYGLKTFMHFLLENQRAYTQTNNLWATPQLPLRPIKDAVQSMIEVITEQDSLDRLSMEIFATTSRHEINLTDDLQMIADTLYARQAGHYDSTTNIGGGLHQAIVELSSARARPNAKKVIIILSDGLPNIDESGNYVGDGAWAATDWALRQAQEAADMGCTIHTISVGSNADRTLMQEIAAIGGGTEFYAGGNPEEYTEQLRDIFRTLGGKRPVQLIQ